MMDAPKFYAVFDGDEIEGERYPLGAELPETMNPGLRAVLLAQGRISSTRPTVTTFTVPIEGVNKDVADMSREELEGAMMVATRDKVATASDDQLRDAIAGYQREQGIETKPLADTGNGSGEGDARPLNRMNTAELVATAEAEGVTFGEDVTTNPQRAAAIQAKRDAG